MKCPRCGAKVKDNLNLCNECGQDLAVIHHLYRISNAYYNMGLEKAQVRDLSGAVTTLRKSLQFNKYNIQARNLLGLTLNEMGETVSALSEWVLSKYLQPEDNDADRFINMVQKNAAGLDSINQTIKKYNTALNSARNGSEDLAVIQLKKVVALNPKFVRAQQLLSLLYIKAGEYQKAHKCLRQARKIDYNNTTTLRYMMEIGDYKETVSKSKSETAATAKPTKNSLANVTPVGSYKEEKRSLMPFISVLIGILIGVLATFFLIRPTILNHIDNKAADIAVVNDELASKETELSKANGEISTLQAEVKKLKKEARSGDTEQAKKMTAYEQLLKGVSLYQDNKKTEAASSVADYKESDFTLKEAKTLYNLIAKELTEDDAAALFESGRAKYNSGKYDEAITDLEAAIAIDAENQDALYFLGRAYQQKNKTKLAKEYYGKVLAVDDTTSRAAEAKSRLRQLGVSNADIAKYSNPNSTNQPG